MVTISPFSCVGSPSPAASHTTTQLLSTKSIDSIRTNYLGALFILDLGCPCRSGSNQRLIVGERRNISVAPTNTCDCYTPFNHVSGSLHQSFTQLSNNDVNTSIRTISMLPSSHSLRPLQIPRQQQQEIHQRTTASAAPGRCSHHRLSSLGSTTLTAGDGGEE
jgi:hypothetical protein